ncbi:MAG: hypothetical protein ACRDYC_04120 [Acidimicrobiales bacterium]
MTKRRRPPATRRVGHTKFWGDADAPVPQPPRVRPSQDPGALVRSLGAPPLIPDANASQRILTEVYEAAVRAATAMAAASGLLEDPQSD